METRNETNTVLNQVKKRIGQFLSGETDACIIDIIVEKMQSYLPAKFDNLIIATLMATGVVKILIRFAIITAIIYYGWNLAIVNHFGVSTLTLSQAGTTAFLTNHLLLSRNKKTRRSVHEKAHFLRQE